MPKKGRNKGATVLRDRTYIRFYVKICEPIFIVTRIFSALFISCVPRGARTLDPLIKSQLLYQLS